MYELKLSRQRSTMNSSQAASRVMVDEWRKYQRFGNYLRPEVQYPEDEDDNGFRNVGGFSIQPS